MDITFKTKKMVENGLVLDDRGNWIPLIDKLQMERFFIDHLATGEVLRNKRWVTIEEAKAIDKSVNSQPAQETVKSEAVAINPPVQLAANQLHEVSVQSHAENGMLIQQKSDDFSFNNFLDESAPAIEPEMEETNHCDITHEHCAKMIDEGEQAEMVEPVIEEVAKSEALVEHAQEINDSPNVTVPVKEQGEKAPSVESFFVDYTEHETVILSTCKMEDLEKVDDSLIAASMARATRKIAPVTYKENIDEILESIEEFDEWDKEARKRQALFFAIASGVAAIIGSSAIILLILI
jgi:hypothetical protein